MYQIMQQIKHYGKEEDTIAQIRMRAYRCTGGYHLGNHQWKLSPLSLKRKRSIKELNLSCLHLIQKNLAKRGECSSKALKRRYLERNLKMDNITTAMV